jgi:hypothetical protein
MALRIETMKKRGQWIVVFMDASLFLLGNTRTGALRVKARWHRAGSATIDIPETTFCPLAAVHSIGGR